MGNGIVSVSFTDDDNALLVRTIPNDVVGDLSAPYVEHVGDLAGLAATAWSDWVPIAELISHGNTLPFRTVFVYRSAITGGGTWGGEYQLSEDGVSVLGDPAVGTTLNTAGAGWQTAFSTFAPVRNGFARFRIRNTHATLNGNGRCAVCPVVPA